MNYPTAVSAALMMLVLGACEKATVVAPPATVVTLPAPVPIAGPPGPAGPAGATGYTGAQGVTGEAGSTGATGAAGQAGTTGATGEPGKTGGDTVIVVPAPAR